MEDENKQSPETGDTAGEQSETIDGTAYFDDTGHDTTETTETTDETVDTNNETEENKEVKQEEKLLAGKYKTEEDLNEALSNLGLDPDDYSTPQEKEVAYKVALKEFTRQHMKRAETEKQNGDENKVTEEQKNTDAQADPVEEIMKTIDTTNVKTVEDMVRVALQAVVKYNDQALSGVDEKVKSSLQQVQEQNANREKSLAEISELESEVPRLKSDGEFRKAFATFVVGLKSTNQFGGLASAMKTFIRTQPTSGEQKTDKPKTLPDGVNETPKMDEADEIVRAYQANKEKYSI